MTAVVGNTSMVTPETGAAAKPVVALNRRTVDTVLVGLGAVFAVVLGIAAGLLTWGSNFSNDYVRKELSSQEISFPSAAALTEEGRTDLVKFADQKMVNGKQAEGYASFINGHLAKIGGGKTYATIGADETAAKAAVKAATDAGKPAADIAKLQATADGITNTRNTLFKGETLRGLLLSAFAWSTIGRIAGIASIAAYIAAAVMLLLVLLGLFHIRRLAHAHKAAAA